MTPTLVDIARETRTSVSTVSRVLSGGPIAQRISAQTRQRVTDAASRMGYRPNLLARSLRTRKSFSIALMLPDISCARHAGLARLIEMKLRSEGYSLLLCASDNSDDLERECLSTLPLKGVDGIIAVSQSPSSENLRLLSPNSAPVVVVDARIDGVPSVRSDIENGAELLCRTLVQKHAGRVLLLAGARESLIAQIISERLEVAKRIDVPANLEPPSTLNTADVDAVVCTNPRIAELYLSTRRDLDMHRTLACFNAGNTLLAMPMPVISCNQDTPAIVDAVMGLLLRQLRGETLPQMAIEVPMELRTNLAVLRG